MKPEILSLDPQYSFFEITYNPDLYQQTIVTFSRLYGQAFDYSHPQQTLGLDLEAITPLFHLDQANQLVKHHFHDLITGPLDNWHKALDCYQPTIHAPALVKGGQDFAREMAHWRRVLTFAGRYYLARYLVHHNLEPEPISPHEKPSNCTRWHQIGGVGTLLPRYLVKDFNTKDLTPQKIADDYNRLPDRILFLRRQLFSD